MNLNDAIKMSEIQSMSPPGFGGTTRKIAKDNLNITNPYALAWSEYEKGDKSHVRPPKGSGAKKVSKGVKNKRSKALAKKGK